MTRVTVDPARRTARVEGGSLWMHATELVNLLHDCIRDTARRVPAPQHEPAAAERQQPAPSLR
jgi:hypothetical protein